MLRRGEDPSPWLGPKAHESSFLARLRLCFRAALLDEVIDSLADWVEAEVKNLRSLPVKDGG